MAQFGFKQHITDFTRETNTSQTIIDLIFSNVSDHLLQCGIHADNLSDHHVVFADYFSKKDKIIKEYNYRPINDISQEEFSKTFEINLNKYLLNCKTDDYISLIQRCLDYSLEQVCPLRTVRSKKPFAPWMKEKNIINAKKIRDKALTKWRKDKDNLENKIIYRNSVKATSRLIHFERSKYLSSIAEKRNSRTLWTVIKNMQHKEMPKSTININTYTDFYCQTSIRHCNKPPSSNDEIDNYVKSVHHTGFEFREIDANTMQMAIQGLKRNKIDCYGISSNLFQSISTHVTYFLTYAFNNTVLLNKYPETLKTSSVRPIPKVSDSTQLSDFRPICLQPIIAKVFEICLNKQLNIFLSSNSILYKHQFGFRAHFSSQMLLHLIDNKVKFNLHHGLLTVIIFLDFSKAFDTVCHLQLLKKLTLYGFSSNALRLIKSYLRTRNIYTTLDGTNSKTAEIQAGVPQGSILGPNLFNIYVADFHKVIPKNVELYQFADDCQLILSFTKDTHYNNIMTEVQTVLKASTQYAQVNNLCLNEKKTKILPIYNRNSTFSKMPFFNTTSSYFVSEAKNLGIYFDHRHNWTKHFSFLHESFIKTFHQLKSLFHMYTQKSDYSLRKLIVYTILLPKLTYCFTLFYNSSVTMERFFNKWNRMTASLITQHYCKDDDVKKCSLESFYQNLRKQVNKFIQNALIKEIGILNIHAVIQPYNARSNAKSLVSTTSTPNSFSQYVVELLNNQDEENRVVLLKKLCLFNICDRH